MNLSKFINELDSIVRGKDLEEFQIFVEDEHGSHHYFEITVDKVNNDITLSVK